MAGSRRSGNDGAWLSAWLRGGLFSGAAVAVLALSPAARSAALSPELAPDDTTVAAGTSLTARPTGCEGGGGVRRYVEAILVTGSGSGERLVAYGHPSGDGSFTFAVPEWVDATEPAVVAGRCMEVTGGPPPGPTPVVTTVFTYADVPIDITAGPPGVPGPRFLLDRDAAEGGQAIVVAATGCPVGTRPSAWLLAGADLSGRSGRREVNGASAAAAGDAIELVLNSRDVRGVVPPPLSTGSYRIEVSCGVGDEPILELAAPVPFEITASNPTDTLSVHADGGQLVVRGEGCTDGRPILLDATLRWMDPETGDGGSADISRAVVPAVDGSWSATLSLPARAWQITASARCGFPTVTGFSYSELTAEGTQPASSETTSASTSPPPAPRPPSSTPDASAAEPLRGSPSYAG